MITIELVNILMLCFVITHDILYILLSNSNEPSGTGMFLFGLMLLSIPLSSGLLILILSRLSLHIFLILFMGFICSKMVFNNYVIDFELLVKSYIVFIHTYAMYVLVSFIE
jgi:hypothetical protein